MRPSEAGKGKRGRSIGRWKSCITEDLEATGRKIGDARNAGERDQQLRQPLPLLGENKEIPEKILAILTTTS